MTIDFPAPQGALTLVSQHRPTTEIQELNAMLLHEILARTRMREDQSRARRQRLANQLVRARRWQRLARYADRRAHRALASL